MKKNNKLLHGKESEHSSMNGDDHGEINFLILHQKIDNNKSR